MECAVLSGIKLNFFTLYGAKFSICAENSVDNIEMF